MVGKLGDADMRLRNHGFLRIHRNYLVNMKYICG
ncbi:LytTR family transcriptional regulator DNA-binding domain-containing protein, partial [Eubacterium aggregans]